MGPNHQEALRLTMIECASLSLLFLLQVPLAFAQPSRPASMPSLLEDEYRVKDLKLRERALDIEEMKSAVKRGKEGYDA